MPVAITSHPTPDPATALDADQIGAVLALVDAATDADGVAPVSEHVRLHLRHGGAPDAVTLLAYPDGPAQRAGDLGGFAHVDLTEDGPGAELAVHPAHRRRGVASALLDELEAISDRRDPAGRLRLWAHGRQPAAAALAAARGYVTERVLWRMRRSLSGPLPEPDLPAGVRIRPFRVSQDEAAWVEVNNRAFASHPDQGGWTVHDLAVREAEPWFDPAGFLLAERVADGALVGFHWTKVHSGEPAGGGAADPIGEVYVVGVDPAAQGSGLGRALTLAGLHHLASAGLGQVMLYVDESNTAAVRMYRQLGFTEWDADVQYRRPAAR